MDFIYREAPDTLVWPAELRSLRLSASKWCCSEWTFIAHFWDWAPSSTGRHIGPATGSPASHWMVVLPDDLLFIMRLPRGPVAIWHVLQMTDWEIQAALLVFQMSHGDIRVWKGKAKTQIPAEELTCKIYRLSRSIRFLSVFGVSKTPHSQPKPKNRIKVL